MLRFFVDEVFAFDGGARLAYTLQFEHNPDVQPPPPGPGCAALFNFRAKFGRKFLGGTTLITQPPH